MFFSVLKKKLDETQKDCQTIPSHAKPTSPTTTTTTTTTTPSGISLGDCTFSDDSCEWTFLESGTDEKSFKWERKNPKEIQQEGYDGPQFDRHGSQGKFLASIE